MENKKIWHTPDENPSVFNAYPILVLYEAGDTPEIMSSKDYFQLTHDRYVNRWCYWDEFIKSVDATSKALDVAVGALKRLRDMPEEDNDQWFNYCCSRCVLAEISEIMKGGK